MKRLLDCNASDFKGMSGRDLKQSIQASEGRVMLAETMATVPHSTRTSPMQNWPLHSERICCCSTCWMSSIQQ